LAFIGYEVKVSSFKFKAQSKNKIKDKREKIKVKNLPNSCKVEPGIFFEFLLACVHAFATSVPIICQGNCSKYYLYSHLVDFVF
jgi:hypothetical protein